MDPRRVGVLRTFGRFIGIRTPLLALAVTVGASFGLYALATKAVLTDFETAPARITRVESDGTVEIVARISVSVEVGTKAVLRHDGGVIDASVVDVAREGAGWSAGSSPRSTSTISAFRRSAPQARSTSRSAPPRCCGRCGREGSDAGTAASQGRLWRIRGVWRWVRPALFTFVNLFVAMVAASFLRGAYPYVFGLIVDEVILHRQVELLGAIAAGFLMLFAADQVLFLLERLTQVSCSGTSGTGRGCGFTTWCCGWSRTSSTRPGPVTCSPPSTMTPVMRIGCWGRSSASSRAAC